MYMYMYLPLMIVFMLIMINVYISKKSFYKHYKQTPFECGFNNLSISRIPFSIQFFFIALIFLIFDIEIALILPMPYIIMNNNSCMLIILLLIILILTIGLFYEWKKGLLKWFS